MYITKILLAILNNKTYYKLAERIQTLALNKPKAVASTNLKEQ